MYIKEIVLDFTTSSWKTWAGRKIQTGCTSVFPIFVLLYQTSQEFLFSKIAWHVCGLAEHLELEFIIFSGLRKAGDAPGHKIVVALFVQSANLVGLRKMNHAFASQMLQIRMPSPAQARPPRPSAAKRAQANLHTYVPAQAPHVQPNVRKPVCMPFFLRFNRTERLFGEKCFYFEKWSMWIKHLKRLRLGTDPLWPKLSQKRNYMARWFLKPLNLEKKTNNAALARSPIARGQRINTN